MVNTIRVVDTRKVIRVVERVKSTPKGLRVRQVETKPPKRPVRANQKRAGTGSQHSAPHNEEVGLQTLNSWPEDPPLLVFEPELESSFDSKAHTKVGLFPA